MNIAERIMSDYFDIHSIRLHLLKKLPIIAEAFQSRFLQMSCIDFILITLKKKRLRKKVHSGNFTLILKPNQASKNAFCKKKKKNK